MTIILIIAGLLAIITIVSLWQSRQGLRAQLHLKEEQARLAKLAFQSHEGILILDAEKHILMANESFSRITGYAVDEILGKKYESLLARSEDPEFYKSLWQQLDDTASWSGEFRETAKDGVDYPAWHTISAISDEQGQVSHYVVVFSDITQFKETEAYIHHMAYFDPLTELPNRRSLFDHLARELSLARRHEVSGAVLYIDLDTFKEVNDHYGHNIGDEVLKLCANRLKQIIRHEDTAARLGGDEFVIVISVTEKEHNYASVQAQVVAEKIRESFIEPFLVGNHRFYITTSIGIALFSSAHPDVSSILAHADAAMYAAKDAGRNSIRFYESPLKNDMADRLQLEASLRNSIEQDDLLLYFHPYFDGKGNLCGAETLIRWQHPTEGMLKPDVFIPLAEQAGLLPDLGQWIFRNTFMRLREWKHLGIHIPSVSINVSPFQFYQPDFVEMVLAELNNTKVDPHRIMLEMTEGVLIKNIDDAIYKMKQLQKVGVRFSIDDFGTGYSSLSYLKMLPVSQLKIDQSFIRDVVTDTDDATIVRAIIGIAQGLKLGVIAEGIEDEEQIRFLNACGDIHYQGHYFSRPLPEKEFLEFVRSANTLTDRLSVSQTKQLS